MMYVLDAHFQSNGFPADLDERPASNGMLRPLLQPHYPQWQRTLAHQEAQIRDGVHVWRVSLGRAWRRISAPANLSLDDLATAILDAFDYDSDHLYNFELRNRQGRTLRFSCPYEMEVEAFTDEVTQGELPIPEGGVMKFTFDYGTPSEFAVKLEEVGPRNALLKHAKVTAKGGRSPAQYGWDAG